MPSDFERALFGVLNAVQGYQSQKAVQRDLSMRMQDRDIARRRMALEERRVRLAELTGAPEAPLEVLEQGRRLAAGGIRVGQAYDAGEIDGSVAAFERFSRRREEEQQTALYDPRSGQFKYGPKRTKIIPGTRRAAEGMSNPALERYIGKLEEKRPSQRTPEDEEMIKWGHQEFRRRSGFPGAARPPGGGAGDSLGLLDQRGVSGSDTSAWGAMKSLINVYRSGKPAR